jgi:hypothetical protein
MNPTQDKVYMDCGFKEDEDHTRAVEVEGPSAPDSVSLWFDKRDKLGEEVLKKDKQDTADGIIARVYQNQLRSDETMTTANEMTLDYTETSPVSPRGSQRSGRSRSKAQSKKKSMADNEIKIRSPLR